MAILLAFGVYYIFKYNYDLYKMQKLGEDVKCALPSYVTVSSDSGRITPLPSYDDKEQQNYPKLQHLFLALPPRV
ncbi:Protein CBG27249 [Caenorhabditis briggsae]|uniref:Protein CBG27249 n=1 Tax=Caenorhabditis briggsae TaxID=6238 RepID=B6IFX1_CAEBR|nr:Protein CBG27249 [Caenorhabditis briggsae]CAR98787.1 Protein CBG27249 [Caenorhabditis briggsae]